MSKSEIKKLLEQQTSIKDFLPVLGSTRGKEKQLKETGFKSARLAHAAINETKARKCIRVREGNLYLPRIWVGQVLARKSHFASPVTALEWRYTPKHVLLLLNLLFCNDLAGQGPGHCEHPSNRYGPLDRSRSCGCAFQSTSPGRPCSVQATAQEGPWAAKGPAEAPGRPQGPLQVGRDRRGHLRK